MHTIKDALQYISSSHSVEITSPTRPGQVIEASRQELIEALPPVLILHLKRFLYDTNVKDVVKIGKQVAFGPELEIIPGQFSPYEQSVFRCAQLVARTHCANSETGTSSEVPAIRRYVITDHSYGHFLRMSFCSVVPPWAISIWRPLYP